MKQIDFSKFDLTTEDGRHSALMEMNDGAKKEFVPAVGISELSLVAVSDFHIDIAIQDAQQKARVTHFASSVELSAPTRINVTSAKWEVSGPVEISTSSTSMFNPTKDQHLALKHHNMAALLANWEKTTQLFDFYTSERRRLKKLITDATGVAL